MAKILMLRNHVAEERAVVSVAVADVNHFGNATEINSLKIDHIVIGHAEISHTVVTSQEAKDISGTSRAVRNLMRTALKAITNQSMSARQENIPIKIAFIATSLAVKPQPMIDPEVKEASVIVHVATDLVKMVLVAIVLVAIAHIDRPRGDKPYGGDKPRGERHFGDKPRGEASTHDRPRSERSYSDRPRSDKPKGDKPYGDKPFGDKPRAGKYFAGKPRAQGGKPYRGGSSAPRGRA